MFLIEEKPFGPYTEYQLVNPSTGEYVSVLPAFGATLNQVALCKKDKVYELMDGCSSYEELITEGKAKFKGSKLFPFPNRIADGTYTFGEKVYHLPVNFPHEKNAIHGIVLESDFRIEHKEVSANGASLLVQYQISGSEEGYPFKVLITILFSLTRDGFASKTSIQNNDSQPIPIGDGWHPYFKTGSIMDDCLLTLPVEKAYEIDKRMIPTGNTIPETIFTKPTRISNHSFDTGYKLKKTNDEFPATVLYDPIQDITLKIWQEAGEEKYNYVQIYIPSDRKCIAVEPMSCLADSFNNKEGLIVLNTGEIRNFSFGLKLE